MNRLTDQLQWQVQKFLVVGLSVLLSIAATLAQAEELYFVHTDRLGTPLVITDSEQSTVWEARSTPFGETEILTEQIEFNVRFPGQYADLESGLSYNYFRDYDPVLGRYVQSDPIGLNGGLNTYGYVNQNPLIYIDPFGLASTSVDAYCKQYGPAACQEVLSGGTTSGPLNVGGTGLFCWLTGMCSAKEGDDVNPSCPVDGGELDYTTGKGTNIWDVDGSYEDAVDAANGLDGGSGFEDKGGGVLVGQDSNGNTVVVRPGGGGKNGGTPANGTIEIRPGGGGPATDKIRFR